MRTKKRTKATNIVIFIIIILAVGLSTYLGAYGTGDIGGYKVQSFGEVIKRGLDLQGGMSILQEVTSDGTVDEETINRTITVLRLRIDTMGVGEVSVVPEGANRIRTEIPGEFDVAAMTETLSKQGKLTFVAPDGTVVITGADIESSQPVINQQTNKPEVSLKLNEEGTKKFADATGKYIGQAISIKMDEDVISSPTVQSVITGGQASITGMANLEEAQKVSGIIQSGALPVTLKTLETKVVGPTLGETAIPLSVKAGFFGILAALLFMALYYRVPGLFADLGLIIFIILVMLAYKVFGVVLTLPGIAGLLLTIGMALDANMLIFERIKEELKNGKSIKSSVDAGFHRALSSIMDSNITTIISGVVLYYMGSGAVRGFALTLIIGVLISMFTAIIITKFVMRLALSIGLLNKTIYFGVKRG
jgi:protein-export SecD/SecF family membrane protein